MATAREWVIERGGMYEILGDTIEEWTDEDIFRMMEEYANLMAEYKPVSDKQISEQSRLYANLNGVSAWGLAYKAYKKGAEWALRRMKK